MISACVELFEFDYLIKLDSAIIKNSHSHIDHRFSFEYFTKRFNSGKVIEDYGGCCPILGTTEKSLEEWANSKKLEASPSIFLMSIGAGLPDHYWAGSCYCLSRANCNKALNQEDVFIKAKDYMCGIEDMSIGVSLSL